MRNKTLFLIRHGKAEDYSFSIKDYDRNLIDRGEARAKLIAQKLSSHVGQGNTLIVSSTANRALQTAHIFSAMLDMDSQEIQLEKSIYEAYYLNILKVINSIPANVENLLLFGHNPGLSDLTNYLCDTYINLKTAHAAKIILPANFSYAEISGSTCFLETIITE